MRCRLCGSSRVNDLGFGDFWCKDCDKYFDIHGEIFYTSDGNKIRLGLDNKKPVEERFEVDHDNFMELTKEPKQVATEAGVNYAILCNIRRQGTKTITESNLKRLSKYLGVNPEELIL